MSFSFGNGLKPPMAVLFTKQSANAREQRRLAWWVIFKMDVTLAQEWLCHK
jgi:hypothetical protein